MHGTVQVKPVINRQLILRYSVQSNFAIAIYIVSNKKKWRRNRKYQEKTIGKTDLNELFLLIIVIFYLLGFRAYNLSAVTLFYGHWIGE